MRRFAGMLALSACAVVALGCTTDATSSTDSHVATGRTAREDRRFEDLRVMTAALAWGRENLLVSWSEEAPTEAVEDERTWIGTVRNTDRTLAPRCDLSTGAHVRDARPMPLGRAAPGAELSFSVTHMGGWLDADMTVGCFIPWADAARLAGLTPEEMNEAFAAYPPVPPSAPSLLVFDRREPGTAYRGVIVNGRTLMVDP